MRTYDVALTALALDELDRRKYRPVIEGLRALPAGKSSSRTGMWDYRTSVEGRVAVNAQGQNSGDGDHSNSQFALLGLIAAQRSGIPIAPGCSERRARHWTEARNPDGGWGYGSSRGQAGSYGSMTAAGVASLFLLGNDLFVQTDKCGVYVGERSHRERDRLAVEVPGARRPTRRERAVSRSLTIICIPSNGWDPDRPEVSREPRLVPRRRRISSSRTSGPTAPGAAGSTASSDTCFAVLIPRQGSRAIC
jgi:hypothetical protein